MAQWQHKSYSMKIAVDIDSEINLLDLASSRLLSLGFDFSGLTAITWPEFDKGGTIVRFGRDVRSSQDIPTVDVFVADEFLADDLDAVIDTLVEAVFKLYPEYQQKQQFVGVEQAQAWLEENEIEW